MAMRVLGDPAIDVHDDYTQAVNRKGWPYFHLNSLCATIQPHLVGVLAKSQFIDGLSLVWC